MLRQVHMCALQVTAKKKISCICGLSEQPVEVVGLASQVAAKKSGRKKVDPLRPFPLPYRRPWHHQSHVWPASRSLQLRLDTFGGSARLDDSSGASLASARQACIHTYVKNNGQIGTQARHSNDIGTIMMMSIWDMSKWRVLQVADESWTETGGPTYTCMQRKWASRNAYSKLIYEAQLVIFSIYLAFWTG